MARKVRRPLPPPVTEPSRSSDLLRLIAVAIISLLFGSSLTYIITRRPTPPPAFVPNGELARVVADYYYDNKDWANARVFYLKAIATGQDNPDVHTDLGNTYRFSDQPQDALREYTKAQTEDPNHENSLFNQAGVYAISLHDRTKAIGIWQDYIARFPKGQHVTEAKLLIQEIRTQSGKNTSKAGGL